MIPAPFDYVVAEAPDHAIELLGKREDAKLLAGGHSLDPRDEAPARATRVAGRRRAHRGLSYVQESPTRSRSGR